MSSFIYAMLPQILSTFSLFEGWL